MKQTESNKMISKKKIEGCGRETQYVTCDLVTIWFGSGTLFSLIKWGCFDVSCTSYLSCSMTKELKKMQFKEGFIWVHSLKLQSITAKKAWWQRWMHLVTLYPTTIRKKKQNRVMNAGCQPGVSFACSALSQWCHPHLGCVFLSQLT